MEEDYEWKQMALDLQCEVIEEHLKEVGYTPTQFCNDIIPTIGELLTKAERVMTPQQVNAYRSTLSDFCLEMIGVCSDMKVKILEEENYHR